VLDLKDATKLILVAKGGAEYAKHLRKHIRSRHTEILRARLLRKLTIQQAQAYAKDLRLNTKSRLIYKGSALVRFKYLKWNKYLKLNEIEQLDLKRVEHVKQIFRKTGCSQLLVGHYIPTVVDQHRLHIALKDA
jgi:spore coat polysaccharide biosynthesis protein SpsF (cytidylyltransferase family)